jgi:vitamin-K-epoxide reductase (warfarin-sensitive)
MGSWYGIARSVPVQSLIPSILVDVQSETEIPRFSASIILTMRFVIAVLALLGAVVSGLALQVHYTVGTTPCSINEKWDCGVVNHSSYSLIEGIPVALIGIIWYLGLVWLGLARQRAVLTLAAAVGLAFSLYLAHVERDILGVWCLYCVISLADIALILVMGFIWLIVDMVHRQERRRW